jgi:hypothetical protein
MADRHLKALMHRHSTLDAKISQLSRGSLSAAASLARLKRMRLAVKDQIEQYRQSRRPLTGA